MPFRSIISRDFGTPWPDPGMTTQRWISEVPTTYVLIRDLIATQPGVVLKALATDYAPEPGDPWAKDRFPHVISWRGDLYLEDGHHRAIRALLRNEASMVVRVLEVDDA